ncbi:hypothetical protein [Microbacterium sp. Leaf159]|uniref:hypothetical protein n=1 Tax=Microbacterium sp. Leaf159 TaxID=1736279 RepID=UPI000700DA98|nr:hypothetical protein [Microbacterium sp. Leaf159]KQR39207.1 hypothetical protein ASF80_07205 [Microbacterium sp. Leaf159]
MTGFLAVILVGGAVLAAFLFLGFIFMVLGAGTDRIGKKQAASAAEAARREKDRYQREWDELRNRKGRSSS